MLMRRVANAPHAEPRQQGMACCRYNGPPQKDDAELAAITAMSPELAQLLAGGGRNGADSSSSNGLHLNGAAHQTGMYSSFDEFLMTLKQSKRKAIRQVSQPDLWLRHCCTARML